MTIPKSFDVAILGINKTSRMQLYKYLDLSFGDYSLEILNGVDETSVDFCGEISRALSATSSQMYMIFSPRHRPTLQLRNQYRNSNRFLEHRLID
jgi:hypothetical protein